MRPSTIALIGLLLAGITAPIDIYAKTPEDLRVRIKTAFDAEALVDAKAYIALLQPLMDAALATPDIDPEDFARISLVYALSLYNDGRVVDAKAVIKTAIDLVDARGGGDDNTFMSNLLQNYAVYQTQSGDPESGLATQKRALALAQARFGPDSFEVGGIYGSMASASSLLGRQRDALHYYRLCIERMDPEKDSGSAYVVNLGNLAANLREAGLYDEALTYSRMNIEAAAKYLPKGHRAHGYAYFNAAEIMMALGRYREAMSLFAQAQQFGQEHRGKISLDTGLFTYGLARAMVANGRPQDAETVMLEAFSILSSVSTTSSPDIPGMIWTSLGRISADRGDLDQAIERENKALELLVPKGNRGNSARARAQVYLAQFLMLKGDYAAALDNARMGLAFYREEYPLTSTFRIEAETVHALLLARTGATQQALDDAQAVIDAIVAQGERGSARGAQADQIVAYQAAYVRYVDIALAAGRTDLAFAGAQRAAYSEIAATSEALAVRATTSDPKAAELARQLQDVQVERLRLERERNFARARSASETQRLDGEIAALDMRLTDIKGQLDTTFPDFERLSRPAPQAVETVRAGLARGHAVVMPLLSDDRLITLVVTRNGLSWDAAPLPRHAARRHIDSLRRSIEGALGPQGNGFDRQAAWALGGAIFTPKLRRALKPARELDILGGGSLMSLPLGLLLTQAPTGDDTDPAALRKSAWLIRDFAVSVKPAFVAAPPVPLETGGFLGVGAPVLGPATEGFTTFETAALYRGGVGTAMMADVEALRKLPSLPFAQGELTDMDAALDLPGSRLITGADATETRIRTSSESGELARYSVIAFATHGLTSGNLQALREPALVMTPPDQPDSLDDGLLTASDVAGLRLNARWVILSACNSGAGREAGAGYTGLAKAFMQAGADSLLVSMWPVRDDVAGRLSVDTVRRHTKGVSQAQALRQSVLALMRDTSVPQGANPAIWAPFSLVVR